MKKIDFMLTAFRDGFQSVFGARVFSSDFLPVVEEAAAAGITHFEAGGGALFQAAYFYSNEDAFRVMDDFRRIVGNSANLQTLARGINVVGLDSQPRDIIKLHAQLMKKHGITTIRNFDALNDVNNLLYSGTCIAEAGLKHEITVTMMELPPGCVGHTVEFYESILRRILDSGIPYDSVCFKDASGTSTPHKVYETIRMARNQLGDHARIVFHSHETAGCSVLAYHAALEGGADQLDLSIAPLSGGTCQPDILTMWHALRGTQYDLDIDVKKIIKLEESLKRAMKDYFMPPEATQVNPLIPFFPMPGGALTANTQMLRDNGLMEKYPEVIAAMGEAVARGGFGTSVTPVSQFYFQQAFNRKYGHLNLRFMMVGAVREGSWHCYDIVREGIDKGMGLADLCETVGLTLADAVSVGDSANDVGMLKAAGLGCCMANGSDDAKKAADRIIGDVREDGLAALIEELWFNGPRAEPSGHELGSPWGQMEAAEEKQ